MQSAASDLAFPPALSPSLSSATCPHPHTLFTLQLPRSTLSVACYCSSSRWRCGMWGPAPFSMARTWRCDCGAVPRRGRGNNGRLGGVWNAHVHERAMTRPSQEDRRGVGVSGCGCVHATLQLVVDPTLCRRACDSSRGAPLKALGLLVGKSDPSVGRAWPSSSSPATVCSRPTHAA